MVCAKIKSSDTTQTCSCKLFFGVKITSLVSSQLVAKYTLLLALFLTRKKYRIDQLLESFVCLPSNSIRLGGDIHKNVQIHRPLSHLTWSSLAPEKSYFLFAALFSVGRDDIPRAQSGEAGKQTRSSSVESWNRETVRFRSRLKQVSMILWMIFTDTIQWARWIKKQALVRERELGGLEQYSTGSVLL